MREHRWFMVTVLVTAGFGFVTVDCGAQAKCPWLNAATAAGVLGGDVQMTLSAPVDPGPFKGVGQATYPDQVRMDRFDVNCTFSRKVDSAVYSLRIEVKTMNDPAKEFPSFLASCPGTTVSLKAIGNEAVKCVTKSSGHISSEGLEQVIARVRERAFVLTIRHEVISPLTPAAGLTDTTRNIAEQVAGSLF